MKKNNSHRRGFTVLETSVVSIVAGISIVSLLSLYNQWLTKYRVHTTKTRIETIQNAMQTFMSKQKRVPCAASLTAPAMSSGAGAETDCSLPPVAGTSSVAGRAGNVRIGAVPTQILGLGYTVGLDGWGRRMTYAISEKMTTVGGYSSADNGDIYMHDSDMSTPHSLVSPDGSAVYVVVSHGQDGLGAYSDGGVQQGTCPTATLEGKNCDGDATFVSTPLYSEANNSQRFDDFVGYAGKNQISSPSVVSFSIERMACASTSCVNDSPFSQGVCAANVFGDACATLILRNNELYINPAIKTPKDGAHLYHSSKFTAKGNNDVVVRAAIPARVLPQSLTPGFPFNVWPLNILFPPHVGSGKEAPVMASIYLTSNSYPSGIEIGRGLVIDPAAIWGGSQGVTGAIIGQGGPLADGEDYYIDIYVFSLGDNNGGQPNFFGTIKISDHSVDGIVEVMETGAE